MDQPTTPQRQIATLSREDLNNRFTYHKPFGDQPDRYEKIRAAMLKAAGVVFDLCPGSPERTRAINALDEAMMLANAAIARNEKPGDLPRE